MDDQFDDELEKRIREVFENYDDASADEGWILLREKYPEKVKRRSIAWIWWSSAAMLLICLGLLWFKLTPEKQQQEKTAGNKKPNDSVLIAQSAPSQPKNSPADSTSNNNYTQTPSGGTLAANSASVKPANKHHFALNNKQAVTPVSDQHKVVKLVLKHRLLL